MFSIAFYFISMYIDDIELSKNIDTSLFFTKIATVQPFRGNRQKPRNRRLESGTQRKRDESLNIVPDSQNRTK